MELRTCIYDISEVSLVFGFFFFQVKKTTVLQNFNKTEEARVEFCVFILSGCWKKQMKICKEYIWFFSQ